MHIQKQIIKNNATSLINKSKESPHKIDIIRALSDITKRGNMFVDSVGIFIASGHGGAGAVSFRREKFVIQGGPDGGDGGRGGDVYFLVDKNTTTLANFRGHKHYKAGNGMQGSSKNCNGKKGKNIVIKVPPGTQVIHEETKEVLLDLVHDGEKVKLLSGGKGGLGNTHFKSASNQRPTYAQKGLPGESLQVRLELKLIADVGLVGFPNAGKSSLIAAITHARPKIANYAFTTLVPNLGVVDIDELHSFVMADIPGLIEGASRGKGLGLQFLQHIERTKILLFMLDSSRFLMGISEEDSMDIKESIFHASTKDGMALVQQFHILYNELVQYAPVLANRPYAIALTKSDVALYGEFGGFVFKEYESLQTKAYIAPSLLEFMQYNIPIESSLNTESHCSRETHLHIESSPHGAHIDSMPQTQSTTLVQNSMQKPLFILPFSSATHYNLDTLKNLLFLSLQGINA